MDNQTSHGSILYISRTYFFLRKYMATVVGESTWSGERDNDGNRTYKVTFRVIGTKDEGPADVMSADGLPQFGDTWDIFGDIDIWAFCQYDTKVTPVLKGEPNTQWDVECTFTTKPPKGDKCQTQQVEDPLLIPAKVSFPFVKYTEEAHYDRFGMPILNSALEQIRGPKVEFDKNRPSIKIEMNVPSLQYPLLLSMKDTVNAYPIWGFPPRCVKLSSVGGERKFYGTCFVYFTWNLEFDVLFETFDRDLVDEGTKVLNGHWGKVYKPKDGLWVLDPIGFLGVPTGLMLTDNPGGSYIDAAYVFAVTALSTFGETNGSQTATIVITVAGAEIVATWQPVTGATGYNLYLVACSNDAVDLGFVGTTANTFFTNDSYPTTVVPQVPSTNTAGMPPDPKNPQHFIQFKDRKGENAKVVLNGGGVPSSIVAPITVGPDGGRPNVSYSFISIQDNNVGNQLNNTAWWIVLTIPIQALPWQESEYYFPGNLVTLEPTDDVYLCIAESDDDVPPDPDHWLLLPLGPVESGSYMSTTTYSIGEYVVDDTGDTAGTIHVEYYPESDFTLLGIPLQLDFTPTG